MLRRLLERLEHRVERRLRQHVHFVDQIDFVAADGRRVARVIENIAHVVDAGVRRRIELEQIDESTGVDFHACRTDAAGCRRDAVDAVEALREDARDRRLADAARSGQQIRVMQPPALERIGERRDDVFLTGKLGEGFRPPLAREDLIAHRIVTTEELADRSSARFERSCNDEIKSRRAPSLPSDRPETRREPVRTRSVHGRT